uniref:Uncharacterized protein n=1 Tax=Rhizophora mucronata TaxID=61149 RepID=A0A2P2MNX4_RHIMU
MPHTHIVWQLDFFLLSYFLVGQYCIFICVCTGACIILLIRTQTCVGECDLSSLWWRLDGNKVPGFIVQSIGFSKFRLIFLPNLESGSDFLRNWIKYSAGILKAWKQHCMCRKFHMCHFKSIDLM